MKRSEPMRPFLFGSAFLFGATFVLFWTVERPGLGIAYGYFLAIILVALVTGPRTGVSTGLLSTALYAIGVYVNPHVPVATLPTLSTAIRGVAYVSVGLVVGLYASRSRALTARLGELMDELRILADRDVLTGLPNTRAFEVAVSARLEAKHPFVLLVGDFDGLKRINESNGYDEGNDVLQRVAAQLKRSAPNSCDVARIGGDEFAVLLGCETPDIASRLAHRFERELESEGAKVTFGWALFPKEGSTALSLYRIADERLYARKLLRGERRDADGSMPGLHAVEQ